MSLLCLTLVWVQGRKCQIQSPLQKDSSEKLLNTSSSSSENSVAKKDDEMMNVPKVIYALRAHWQISFTLNSTYIIIIAMKELKQTSYNHIKAALIGSRDQLCIHPDLKNESNTNEINYSCIIINFKFLKYKTMFKFLMSILWR